MPLTQQPSGLHAWKVIIPPEHGEPELRTHEGYEWLYVLSGQLRLILADHDITMGPGEVAEFDTRLRTGSAPPATSPSRSSACSAGTANATTCAPSRAATPRMPER